MTGARAALDEYRRRQARKAQERRKRGVNYRVAALWLAGRDEPPAAFAMRRPPLRDARSIVFAVMETDHALA